MPDVVGTAGRNDMAGRDLILPGIRDSLFPEDPPNGRRPQVQPRSAEGIGDPDLSHGGAEDPEPLNKVADEIGIPVDRHGKLQQGVRPFFFDTRRPGGNGRRRDPEGVCGLLQGPAPGGTQLENGHALVRAITGPALR